MNTLRRTLHPETRVLDEAAGLVEYVASDETIDSYREVIRAGAWRFDHFKKNSPFVDSHDYGSIDKVLGRVVDFKVKGKRLVETVQWALHVGNERAELGWKLLQEGMLPAVSVGFWPVRSATKWDNDRQLYDQQLAEMEMAALPDGDKPRVFYTEVQQVELSAVVIGANPNALAVARMAGLIDDAAFQRFSGELARLPSSPAAVHDAPAAGLRARQRRKFLERIQQITSHP